MRRFILLAFVLVGSVLLVDGEAVAQTAGSRDSAFVAALEQRVEDAVVARRMVVLDSIYVPELRYKHATGESESRAEWLASVDRARYASRQVDSLDVEVHGDIALSTGRIHIRLAPDDPEWGESVEWREYTVRYARVYAKRGGRWRLLTHHSTGLTFSPSGALAPTLSDTLPAAVVQRFVDAANARDAARMAVLVAPEAVFATFPDGQVIAQSRDSIHALYARLIPTIPPDVRITVRNRIADGPFVIDEEYSSGSTAEGERSTWIYHVLGGLIQRAWVLVAQSEVVP